MLELRRLTQEDWQRFRELRLSALSESPSAFGAKLTDWQGKHDSERRWRARLADVPCNLVAALDGAAVGMASGCERRDRRVELISMWVAPAARGRGVGDQLIQAIASWALGQGAEQLVLRVYERSQHARALYVRNGFQHVGKVNHRSGDAEVEWNMSRSLGPVSL